MLKLPAAFIAALFVLSVPVAAQAAPDCGEWLTRAFWQEAGATDVERYLGTGADIKALTTGDLTPLHEAASRLFILIPPPPHSSVNPLHEAARFGNAETVNALLDKGADIKARDSYDSTPLHDAARFGNAETVNALLDRGADINARDKRGKTPLHLAARSGKAETVNALLDSGADIKARDEDGKIPFDYITDDSALKGTDAYRRLMTAGSSN